MYKGKQVIIGNRHWWRHPIFPWGVYSLRQDRIDTDEIRLDGYHTQGDGGGGLFKLMVSSHEDNGG